MKNNPRGGLAPYDLRNADGSITTLYLKGRNRWALEALLVAGAEGCTPIERVGPRWSAYVHNLRAMGVAIETITERHEGPYAGNHGRYVLRSKVARGIGEGLE